MRLLLAAALIVATLAGAASAQTPFVSAYEVANPPSHVRFTPFAPIDWQAEATPARIGVDIEHATEADIERLRANENDIDGGAYIEYDFAAPALSGRHWLISPAGVSALRIEFLRGAVIVGFPEEAPGTLLGQMFSGDAVARAQGAIGSGFVVRGEGRRGPRRIRNSSAEIVTRGDARVLRYSDGRRSAETILETPWFAGLESSYGFSWQGQDYVFVSWGADEEGQVTPLCARNYYIYSVGETLERVAATSHDCDV